MTTQTVKRIVCLANSRKHGGRCVAGKELLPDGRAGGWIRPVSDRAHGEVSEHERQYEDGNEPQLLDVVEMRLLAEKPECYHSENWLIDANVRWTKVGQVGREELPQWADPDEPLWSNDGALNDRMPIWEADYWAGSMRLIRVEDLLITVSKPYRYGSPYPFLKVSFNYLGDSYALRVTNPDIENTAKGLADGKYPIGGQFLSVCIAEPYKGFAYKVVSAIIKP